MPQNQTMYVYHSISGGQGFQGPLGPPPRMNPSAPGQQLPPQPPQPQQQQQQLSGASGPALMAAIQAMQAAAAAQGRPPLGAPTYSAPMGQPGMRPHAPVAPQPNMTHSAVPDYPARSRQQQQHPQHVPPQACPPGSNEGHQELLQQLQAALSAPQGPASHAGGQQQQHHHQQQQQPQQQRAAGPSTNSQQQTMGQPAGGNTWQQHPRLSVSKDEALNAEKQQAARMREQQMNRNTQLLQQMQQQHSQHRRQRAPPPSMLPPPQQRQQQHAPHVLHPAGSSAGALGSIPAQQGSWGRQGMGAGALARSSPSSNTSSHPEVPGTAGAGAVGAGARVESPAEAAAAAAAGPGAALSTQQQQLLKGMLSATAIAAGAGGADRGSSHGGWDAAAATDQGGLGRSRSREAGGSQQGAAVLQQGGELSTLQPHVSSSHAGPQQQQQTPVAAQLEQLQQLLQANMQQEQGPQQQQAHQQHQQQEDDAEEITPEVLTLLTMLAASAVYSAAESGASGRPMHPAVNARVLAASKRFLSALVSCDDNASPSDNLAATAAEPDAAAVTTRTSSGILQGEGLGTADAAAADAAAALCALPDLRGGIERSSGSGTLQQRRQRGSAGVEGEGDLEEGRASRRKRARFTSKVDALIAARGRCSGVLLLLVRYIIRASSQCSFVDLDVQAMDIFVAACWTVLHAKYICICPCGQRTG